MPSKRLYSQKHYEHIAGLYADMAEWDRERCRPFLLILCKAFAADSGKFRPSMFLKACKDGLE